SDSRSGNSFLKFKDLCVVRCDDQNIIEPDRRFLALAINPGSIRTKNFRDKLANFIRFLRARALIAVVNDGKESETRAVDPAAGLYLLYLQSRPRTQPVLVKQLGRESANVWMQAPGFFKEKSPICGDCRMDT